MSKYILIFVLTILVTACGGDGEGGEAGDTTTPEEARTVSKHQQRGDKEMPVAIVVGCDPMSFLMSSSEIPHGISEYEVIGGIRGEPVDLVHAPITGLHLQACRQLPLRAAVLQIARARLVLNEKNRYTRRPCPLRDRVDARYRAGAVVCCVGAFAQALLYVNDQNSGVHGKPLFMH